MLPHAPFGPNTEHAPEASDLPGFRDYVLPAAQVGRYALQLAATALMARLLRPRDFGLAGMALTATALGAVISDLGLGMATIQRREVDRERLSTLFWLNTAVGFAVTILVAVVAPVVATFYGEPALTALTGTAGLTLAVAGLRVQHASLLIRQSRFATVAGVELGSSAAAAAIGIAAAASGYGPYAVVLQALSGAVLETAGILLAGRWLPMASVRLAVVRDSIRLGGYLTGFNLLNFAARNLDNVLIGRVWGAEPLGYYSRAYALMMLPIQLVTAPLSRVMIPFLSRVRQPETLERNYLRTVRLVCAVTFPVPMVAALFAEDVVRTAFGNGWEPAAPVYRMLSVAGFAQPLMGTTGWLYVASGRTDRMFRWALFVVPVTAMSFVVGLASGIRGVALSYALAVTFIILPAGVWYASRALGLRAGRIFEAVWPLLVAVALMGVALAALKHQVDGMLHPLGRLGLAAMAGAAVYAVACATLSSGLRRDLWQTVWRRDALSK
jgi:PST family polysaccharide transporter